MLAKNGVLGSVARIVPTLYCERRFSEMLDATLLSLRRGHWEAPVSKSLGRLYILIYLKVPLTEGYIVRS